MIYTAHLGGSQEVCPKVSPAFGMITASLTGNTLSVSGSFQNLIGDFDAAIGGGSHIHKNIAGRNGGVEIVINASVDSDLKGGAYEASENTFELTEEQVMALENRELYINIHSTLFPSGEIRGQLLPPADHLFQANLLGINEVPANNSAATGNVLLELTGNELTVSGSFDDFTSPVATALAGGAHIHTGVAGENGGVIIPLNISLDADQMGGVFDAANNQFTLTDTQVSEITAQGLYINIHSEANMPGEIRGQITPFGAAHFVANLSGDQEVPAVNSSSTGRLHVTYNGDQTISVSGSFNGLEGDLNTALAGGAHLHLAPRGENGGVIFPLNSQVSADNRNGVFLPADNTFTLSSDQVAALFEEGIYVNIHSLVNIPGELRGQLVGQTLSSCGNPVVAPPVVGCPTPELPTLTKISRTRLIIDWPEVTGAEGYVFQARLKGREEWAITATLKNPIARIWAVASREFEYRIKTICTDGTESIYTDIFEFSTIGNLTSSVSQARNTFKENIILTEQLLNPSDIQVAPNPFMHTIQLTYQSTSDNTRVQIYHVSGQKVQEQVLSKNTINHSINVSDVEAGMYLLVIQEEGQKAISRKLIKQSNR